MAKAKKPVAEVNQEVGLVKEKPKTRQDLLKLYKEAHLQLKKGKGGPKPKPVVQAPEA
jgi:hypothetical protein